MKNRKTAETDIKLKVNPWGKGTYNIDTGLGFFDHILSALSLYSKMDIELKAKGDLKTGPHHLIEDTGLVLGEAVLEEVAKKGFKIQRFGKGAAPMDEALAEVFLDLGGRPFLVWKVDLTGEVAGIKTEDIKEFFYGFTRGAKATVHIRAYGENVHHTIEAIFKAFGLAMREALTPSENLPSTKGVVV